MLELFLALDLSTRVSVIVYMQIPTTPSPSFPLMIYYMSIRNSVVRYRRVQLFRGDFCAVRQ